MHLKKIALIVEYEGTRFHGFQLQPDTRTVQLELERAIQAFTGETLRVICASRTDAGVHASGQVVSFRTQSAEAPETFVKALNHFLPEDVAVLKAFELPMGFDIRTQATAREYRYLILTQPVPSPLWRARAWVTSLQLDVAQMNAAAHTLLGTHDFASFAGPLAPKAAETVKALTHATFSAGEQGLLEFRIVGNSFFHQQVRRMVGALTEIGRGKLSAEAFAEYLQQPRRGSSALLAPAQGLCLVRVYYNSDASTGAPSLTPELSTIT